MSNESCLCELGHVIGAPVTPLSSRVAFSIFEWLENDEAPIIKFIGYGTGTAVYLRSVRTEALSAERSDT